MSVNDIIKGAFEQKPSAVQTAFNDVMKDKLADVINIRRQEVASSMFDGNDQEETDEDV